MKETIVYLNGRNAAKEKGEYGYLTTVVCAELKGQGHYLYCKREKLNFVLSCTYQRFEHNCEHICSSVIVEVA